MRAYIYAFSVAVLTLSTGALVIRDVPGAEAEAKTQLSSAPQVAPGQITFNPMHAEALMAAINAEREFSGLPPLIWDPALAAAARGHAEDMERRNYFDHASPEGAGLHDRVTGAYPLLRQTMWEARNQPRWEPESLADDVATAWSSDLSQLSAVLDPSVTHAGAAIVRRAYDGRAVMVFGGRMSM